ncbi:tRNA1(Val) (adenine(37)-N6)-methyltransferase [Mangrovibacterium diazotrophicum]|uniref:tRNA1(Val) (adenine(37)-N6)-methyltransferase n=1 Tax=Mangrovibacterium diazotrophicum TaxID=1261403 RepID=A0A419W858_9BACT|nr:methyltransferase [Mangrovibacterium diazotrophicum]RKD91671.1 tRNA1Val (adenine37-N6)-methyltransferase [Mangrovibacterium diazotrophicum]
MAKNTFFQFKQFRVVQEQAAMKVGIDGVLLGAWVDFGAEQNILDVGAGTGLLALMAAQRTSARVDAVEIEPSAALEAESNFRNSPWVERLQLFVAAFQEFETEKTYDHIISNPPFFDESPKSGDDKRAKARHADSLTLVDLLTKAADLLEPRGRISLVLPSDKEERLRYLARTLGLWVTKCARVFPDERKKSHRILVELSRDSQVDLIESIYIRHAETGEYTEQYRQLTKDFYLAF